MTNTPNDNIFIECTIVMIMTNEVKFSAIICIIDGRSQNHKVLASDLSHHSTIGP